MASKTPKKRARMDAAAKDSASSPSALDVSPSRCLPSQPNDVIACPKSGVNGVDATGDGSAPTPTPTGQLRAELESARRCIEQLRREKTDEARRAREQADSALRQLAERLRDERQRVIEQVRQRYVAESSRAAARHERELQRLRDELDRCRAQVRDDLERRAGAGGLLDAAERARLLQKVADAGAAKRRAEEALRSAVDGDRQKAAEIRRLHEECRAEVARVSKEANVEVRRLLDELKMKDHQLALLDRNQYPDRGIGIGIGVKPMSGDSSTTKDQDAAAAAAGSAHAAKSDKALKQADLSQAETVAALRADVDRLTSDLKASENQRSSLTDKLKELNRELATLRQPASDTPSDLGKPSLTDSEVENISGSDPKRHNIGVNKLPVKPQPKAVRFLLPGETLPVLARETPTSLDDDGTGSVNSDVSDTASLSSMSSSSSSSLRLSPDSTTLFDENITKNYHLLLSEHLSLQRNVANLLLSWTQTSPALPSNDEKPTCGQDCAIEKESMKATIETLTDKLGVCEETANQLREQLKDQQEQNEELEFRLLELEESSGKNKNADSGSSVVDLLEKNQSLEIEVTVLRQKLVETAMQPTDAILELLSSSGMVPKVVTTNEHEVTAGIKQKNEMVEDEDGRSLTEETVGMDEDVAECCVIVETAADGGSEGTTDLDEDDQLGLMTCSMSSTTSGFDDNSCASSVVGIDEMPSEETWNFDVQEEMYREPVAAKPPPFPGGEDSQQSVDSPAGRTITAEQAKQMEKIWLSRMEKLERRLLRAVESEQRARDQMALLCEEKDRRIGALERQVDALEASDFRLTKTIHVLEQLERTFSRHFLGAVDSVEPHHLNIGRTANASMGVVEQEDGNCENNRDQLKPTILDGELGHPCGDKACLQCRACQTLKGTINLLHSALAEQSEVDRRVRGLEEGANDTESSRSDDQAALEVVDFEAEYRELDALFKELKRVLMVDRPTEDCPLTGERNDSGRENVIASLSVDTGVQWNLDDDCDDDDDETVSMVTSPDSEVDSPVLAALSGRNRSLEISEQYLRQQISDLEMERDQLREMVRGGEATIAELGTSLAQARTSEKSMTDEVSRLRAKNDWMSGRIDGLLELVGRLEEADRAHRAAAGELRLRAERHSAGEADLRRELDNAVDEQVRAETRCRRWVAQLEDERDALAAHVDELTERNAELEGREAALECRVRKMETVEQGLRSELADLERAVGDKSAEIFEERLLTENSSGDYDELHERAHDNCRTTAVVVFLKQKLEQVNRSNVELEEHLRQKAACERRLRGTIKEFEKSDYIWQEKVDSLETQKKTLMQKIDDLQARLTDIQATVTSVKLPDPVSEDEDDVELSHWSPVEGATRVIVDEDSTVTSSHWVMVEQLMESSKEAGEESETFVKELNTEVAEETRVETDNVENSHSDDAKSPPPLSAELEVDSVDQQTTGSSIPTAANEPYESVTSILLKCTDLKPEVQRVSVDRKLIVIRASDIRRSRSADIFRPHNVAATSGPAAARAQSETRDVTESWNALLKTEQMLALEALSSPQENGPADEDEVQQKQERKDDDLDLMRESEHQTSNQEAQTGSGNGAVRPSLIPRIAPRLTSTGGVEGSGGLSPALVGHLPIARSARPGLVVAAAPGGQFDGRKTPVYSTASSRSLIPRPVADITKNSSGDETEALSAANTKAPHSADKPAAQNKTTTTESSFLGSLSSTGASDDEAARSDDVRVCSVSSASSCPGISSVAPDSRE